MGAVFLTCFCGPAVHIVTQLGDELEVLAPDGVDQS